MTSAVYFLRVSAIFLIATCAQFTWAGGLFEYYQKALLMDPDYAAARSHFDSEIRSRDLAGSAFLPSVNLTASSDNTQYQRRDVSALATQKSGYSPTSIAVRLSQPVFSMDRIAFMKENEARAVRAEWVLAQARQDLGLRVVQTAFNFMLNQDQLSLAQAQALAMKAQLSQLEGLLVSRSSTRTDVADARARYELALVQIKQAQSLLAVRKLEFIKLTGTEPDASLQPLVASPALQAPEPADPQEWIDAARERSYKVLANRASVQLAQATIGRIQAGNYPTLSLVASSQQSRESTYFTATERVDSVGVQLTMNLFDGGNTRTQTAQAVAQAERAKNELLSAQHDAAIAAGQAFWGVMNGLDQVNAMEQAVMAAELALEGTRMGIKANVKTYADELNAVQLVYATRRDLQKERYSYWLSRAQLLWGAGMSAEDLGRLISDLLH